MAKSVWDETLLKPKRIIVEEIGKASWHSEKVLLFGSQVRGFVRSDSDWDFYVIIGEEVAKCNLPEIVRNIRRRSVRAGFSGDVLIDPKKAVETRKDKTGYLTYYVFKEGKER